MSKYDLDSSLSFHFWNHWTFLKWHINRLDYPAKGIKINLLFHMCYTHTHTRMIVRIMRTCNSLIWCYSYAVMFDILCYSYWWSTNIWWGLVASSHHQPTEQHSLSHKLKTHTHTRVKKTWPSVHFKQQSICKVSKNKNSNDTSHNSPSKWRPSVHNFVLSV